MIVIYDLEERTAKFAEEVIKICKEIRFNPINERIIKQVVASSGSIGANYCEANESESKKDFIHKIKIAAKEIKETKHWLRLLATAEPKQKEKLRNVWKEAQEILMIFMKIIKSCKTKETVSKI